MRPSHPERRTPTFRQFFMVMAAVTWVALLVPIGARATGSLVTLVDPQTSIKARVENGGALRVAEYGTNDPAQLPVRRVATATIAAGGSYGVSTLLTVPEGYELVIDTVGLQAYLPGGQRLVEAYLHYHVGAGAKDRGIFQIPMTLVGTASNGADSFIAAEGVQLYVDPQEKVDAELIRNATTGNVNAMFSISGHYVRL